VKTSFILVAATMFSSSFAADIVLTDKRTFKDATIVSQSPRKVVIKHVDGLTSVDKQQLPEDLQSRYPIDEAAARAAEERAIVDRETAAKARAAEAERIAKFRSAQEARVAEPAAVSESVSVGPTPETRPSPGRARVALARYFREQYSWSPGAEREVEIIINETREPDGWSDRFTVSGSALIREYQPSNETINTTGMSAKEARRAEYRTRKYRVETKNFEADISSSDGSVLNVTLR
jgi:hypothetical protein